MNNSSGDDWSGDDDEICRSNQDGDEMDINSRNYTILSMAEIKSRQDDAIRQVSTVLSLSIAESCILLRHYNWNISRLQEEWFANEDNVRLAVGLPPIKPLQTLESTEPTCWICFDIHPRENMAAAACGSHWYCMGCWKNYIASAIDDGPGCLVLQCPSPACNAAVGLDMITSFTEDEDRERYSGYLLRSFVDDNRMMKWCPSPGCEFAAELFGSESYNVRCKCLHSFCWNCLEESHSPVDCKTAADWLRNMPEVMSTQWILSYTKSCPKCERPIEKISTGCEHMTCIRPCGYQFCWVCLGPWSGYQHGLTSKCNYLFTGKKDEPVTVSNEVRQSVERYEHYFDMWVNNNMLKLRALKDLRSLQWSECMNFLRTKLFDLGSSEFISKAWEQIVDCSRVLQWTKVYEYYYMEGDKKGKRGTRDYFKYVQGLAEVSLEKLHECAEQGRMPYLEAKGSLDGFNEYRVMLMAYTSAAQKHLSNLVRAVETDLQDVGREQPEAEAQKKGKMYVEEAEMSSGASDLDLEQFFSELHKEEEDHKKRKMSVEEAGMSSGTLELDLEEFFSELHPEEEAQKKRKISVEEAGMSSGALELDLEQFFSELHPEAEAQKKRKISVEEVGVRSGALDLDLEHFFSELHKEKQ